MVFAACVYTFAWHIKIREAHLLGQSAMWGPQCIEGAMGLFFYAALFLPVVWVKNKGLSFPTSYFSGGTHMCTGWTGVPSY